MAEEILSAPAAAPLDEARHIRRLMVFFAVVYVVEGFGQVGGLISQPLSFYLKEAKGWSPLQVTAYLTIFNFPWIIKPVYGIVSDFVPLFGYRRKAYLILANALGAIAYFSATRLGESHTLGLVLLLTAYAMAISSTLCGALLVENGQRFSSSDAFVNQQWLWFNVAAMASALIGGELVQHLSPEGALHGAAAIVALAPISAILATLYLIDESRSRADFGQLKKTFHALVATFAVRDLWVIAIFLFLYYLNPGFGTPLYFYMTDSLKFSQAYIGILGAISSAGWVLGALFYRRFMRGLTSRALINLSILLGTVTTAAYLLLFGEVSAAFVNFASGIANCIAFVATLTLVADYCPQRAEGFAFALMMSLLNLATSVSNNLGSYLYEHVFANRLDPLIILSAGFTALIFLFVPMLRLRSKEAGAAAHRPTDT
ncbi:MAG TPA: MFS transporter [Stellaceae bacterium]|nr:MFS transporter [Stellaceae bacterium]